MGVGIDLVQVSRISESLASFGERFMRRVFTADEIAYASQAPTRTAERLAARFAAKEATFKALALVDHPMNWRDIEVQRSDGGALGIRLHGSMVAVAQSRGVQELAVSLSHEGDYATAIVVARLRDKRD
jgi:holo-[acyl-carrier protein] synthase